VSTPDENPAESGLPEQKAVSILRILGERNFRWLWVGEGVSTLGTQFYQIALPWLVLKLTGSTFALGSIMGLAGLPRALLMLLGGALTDQFSPRRVMMASNTGRFFLVTLLAVLVLTGQTQLWILYTLAFLFGLADAFFYPALFAIMPQILDKQHLHAGNAAVQGVSQLSIAAGPVLAGVMIALVGGALAGGQTPSGDSAETAVALRMEGYALAFAINALTFAVSIFTLRMIQPRETVLPTAHATMNGVLSSIQDGLAYVWKDKALRTVFGIAGALSLFGEGPVLVGVPVLADTRLAEGPAAYGIIMSCFGLGSVVGIVLAGTQPKPATRRLELLLPAACAIMGGGMLTFGFAASIAPAALAALIMGSGLGYTIVVMTTWLQQRTPEQLMGRTMSLLMMAVVGVIPVSMLLVGVTMSFSIQATFVGAGVLILAVAIAASSTSALQQPGQKPLVIMAIRPLVDAACATRAVAATQLNRVQRIRHWANANYPVVAATLSRIYWRVAAEPHLALVWPRLRSSLSWLGRQLCRLAPARRWIIAHAKWPEAVAGARLMMHARRGWCWARRIASPARSDPQSGNVATAPANAEAANEAADDS
jgi:MFS family permease